MQLDGDYHVIRPNVDFSEEDLGRKGKASSGLALYFGRFIQMPDAGFNLKLNYSRLMLKLRDSAAPFAREKSKGRESAWWNGRKTREELNPSSRYSWVINRAVIVK